MQLVQSTKSVSHWGDKSFTSKGKEIKKKKPKHYLYLNAAERLLADPPPAWRRQQVQAETDLLSCAKESVIMWSNLINVTSKLH